MNKSPKISVVLPVYNAEAFIKEAIDSILNQTYADFELIIIDDGSQDNSVEIIKSFVDSRIELIIKDDNSGLIDSLNLGINRAKGEYVARMDADDIAEPNRFLEQVKFLDKNPDVGIVGASVLIFGNREAIKKYPTTYKGCLNELLFHPCFCHPIVLIRKDVFSRFNLRYEEMGYLAEDYLLWIRLAKLTKFHNLKEVLLKYRVNDDSVSVSKSKEQALVIRELQILALRTITGIDLEQKQKMIYSSLLNPFIKIEVKWKDYNELISNIKNSQINDEVKLILLKKMYSNIMNLAFFNTENGVSILKDFNFFIEENNIEISSLNKIKFYMKAFLGLKVRNKN